MNILSKAIKYFIENRLLAYILFITIIAFGIYAMKNLPVDAIPDLGENQVIVYADWQGRSPRDVEDQITFPLSSALQGIAGVKEIRAQSAFGFSMVYVIFEDNVDFYFARTRVLEKLNYASTYLPPNVVPVLGPDATGLGQVFWYTVEGKGYSLQELRSVQDWYIKYALQAVPGVSEVASIGGFVKQYQIDIDPNKLFAYEIPHSKVISAVRDANIDVGAKVVEASGMEFIIRGVGFIKSLDDIENIVISSYNGIPVRMRDIAVVQMGPEFRRGVLDKGGTEVVGGVVVMRYRENPAQVIDSVKQKIEEISPGLPEGVEIIPFYDRTTLINATMNTLTEAIIIQIIITIGVILAFALPFKMSIIISLTLPVSVLFSFILMRLFNIEVHIMSLVGIIIAVGTIVDMGIIMTENIHRKLETSPDNKNRKEILFKGAVEVGGAILGAISTTIIPFLAILVLDGQSAKLFHPVVFTKTFVLTGSLFTAIFLLPLLYYELIAKRKDKPKGKLLRFIGVKKWRIIAIIPAIALLLVLIERLLTVTNLTSGINWLSILEWLWDRKWMLFFSILFLVIVSFLARHIRNFAVRAIDWGFKHRWFLIVPLLVFLFSMYLLAFRIQNEFRPPLEEGSFLFMPVLLPSASLTQAHEVLRIQNEIIAEFPEVESVVGKIGRADTATDPAPITMVETIINLKPRKEWRKGMTKEQLLHDLNFELSIPGVGNIWTQPIQNRIDMLSTGIQTPVGIKIFGEDLEVIEQLALQVERIVRDVPGYRDSYAERIIGKPYIEYILNREEIARFGLRIAEVQQVIETAIGGENLTMTVEGRERYPVRVRYMRDYRDSIEALENILIVTPSGEKLTLARLADIHIIMGPSMINSENGILRGIVFLNLTPGTGPVDFVERASRLLDEKLEFPRGYYYEFSGDYENQIRAYDKLKFILPLCFAGIFLILFMQFKSVPQTIFVLLAIPVTLSGGVILLWLMDFKMSIAVAVGFIALFGIAVDDGIVITTYINQLKEESPLSSVEEIRKTILGAVSMRIRPMFMTTVTTILALLPVLWTDGQGSEIIRPMAVPSIGGMTIGILTLFVVPLLNSWILESRLKKNKTIK
jgi:Cu(I)/Ag(I) efflux system membrane protein CusA/SilA